MSANVDNNIICYPTPRWSPFLTLWSQPPLAPEAKALITLVWPLSSVWLPAHPTVSSLRTLLLPETFLCPQSLESTGLGVWCPTGAQNTFTVLWVMIRWGTQSSAAVDTCPFVCCKPHMRKKWLEQTSWLGFHRPRAVSVFYSHLVQNLIVPE